MDDSFTHEPGNLPLARKLLVVNWGLVFLLCLVGAISIAMLYSAANGHMRPWATRQVLHFAEGFAILFAVALTDLRFWLKYAYVIYLISLLLLVLGDVSGTIGLGAKRWIALGPVQLEPSEVAKVALVLALARYFNGLPIDEVVRMRRLLAPLALIFMPTLLVLRQPDLGTAFLLSMIGAAMFFLAGVRWWKFAIALALVIAAIPVGWHFLHAYQKERLLGFLHPESDPLGAGYHIIQSKIALGSGGVFGKGFLRGTQSHLDFLPEKQTDFIFTTLAEEFGMVGGLTLLVLYALIFAYGFAIGLSSRNQFGRLVALGVTTMVFLYVFVNIAMVSGLVPVVGVPLPLVSYGGTALLTLMFAFGLVLCVSVHRDLRLPTRGGGSGSL